MGWFSFSTWTLSTIFEISAVFTAYSCTFLCVKQSRWNYPIGALSTALFIYVYYAAGLMSSMMLNVYMTFTLIYGWYRWRSDDNTRPVTSILDSSWPWLVGYAFIAVVAYGMAYNTNILATHIFGVTASLQWADTVIFVFSVVAQVMLDNKKIETWFVWVVVNVFAIWVYYQAGLQLVAFQMFIFLINTLYGYYDWKKTFRRPNPYPIFGER